MLNALTSGYSSFGFWQEPVWRNKINVFWKFEASILNLPLYVGHKLCVAVNLRCTLHPDLMCTDPEM